MPACRFIKSATILSLTFLLSSVSLYSQSSSLFTMPEMKPFDSPSMPSVSSPKLGTSFYRPGKQNKSTPKNEKASKEKKAAGSTEDNPQTIEDLLLKKNGGINNLISTLTANDISSLGGLGLLSNLSLTNQTADLYSSVKDSDSLDSYKLELVLEELRKLKKEIAQTKKDNSNENNQSGSSVKNNLSIQNASYRTPAPQKKHSSLMKFAVNGYDIRKTCRIVYLSSLEHDGTFLLTGDRIYESDGKNYPETFYILFKPKGILNGQKTYSIESTVSQAEFNEYSFLYQLSQKKDLLANQTGNLITLHTNDPAWKLDLLLDIAKSE